MSNRIESTKDSVAPKSQLLEKIANRTALVSVVGLGYVGLPLSNRFAEVGFPVLGIDIDTEKIERLRSGRSYIQTVDVTPLNEARAQGRFECGTDLSLIRAADAVIICVPTPLDRHREPDLSFIKQTVEGMAPHVRKGQIIALESTTYPGTTEEVMKPRLEESGLRVGRDLFLAYSPEREDPGNPTFGTSNIPKICAGITADCLEVAAALYGSVVEDVVAVSSTRVAELTKLLENIYRAVNIALVNELKVVAERMGVDIYEVIRAAATKPFGFKPFYPGPGLGGHCIPIDPFYLTWKAREYGLSTRFIELAGEINTAMPDYVVARVMSVLNGRKKSINSSKILILGAAYKKNVDDMRESPSVVLIEKLQALGADVAYSDPHVPVLPKMRAHRLKLASIDLDASSVASFDCIVVATDHDRFDWEMIGREARLIIDTRGVFETDEVRFFRA